MESARFSETLASSNRSVRRLKAKEHHHNHHCHTNLKSRISLLVLRSCNLVWFLLGWICIFSSCSGISVIIFFSRFFAVLLGRWWWYRTNVCSQTFSKPNTYISVFLCVCYTFVRNSTCLCLWLFNPILTTEYHLQIVFISNMSVLGRYIMKNNIYIEFVCSFPSLPTNSHE
jgi:hypothetical protein